MNWIKKPWNRILKNGSIISSAVTDKDADFEDYFFKEDVGGKDQQAIGGVDILKCNPVGAHDTWAVDFWGEYRYLHYIFGEKYSVEYDTFEAATLAVDAFLDKIFDLKVFL